MKKKEKQLIGEDLREYNKKQVLEATIEGIQEYGIYNIRMSDIAKKSGVTTRSIQRYYGDKERLLAEAVAYLVDKKFVATIEFFEKFGTSEHTGYELVEMFFEAQKSFYIESFSDLRILTEIESYLRRKNVNEEVVKTHLEHLRFVHRLLKKLIETGQEDGSIRTGISAEDIANTIESGFMGLMTRLAMVEENLGRLDRQPTSKQILETVSEIVLYYLKQ